VGHLLRNRNFILFLAFFLGMVAGDVARFTEFLVIPVLALVLTVSIVGIAREFEFNGAEFAKSTLIAVGFTYLLASGGIIALSRLVVTEPELQLGFVTVAAAPSGVAVIPFTLILRGNGKEAFQGTIGVYLLAIVFTPAIIYLFGGEVFSPLQLFSALAQLILVPIILSQLIVRMGLAASIERWRQHLINWGFFVVIFTIIGLNWEIFYQEPKLLLRMSLVAGLSTLGLGFAIKHSLPRLGVAVENTVTRRLLGSIKTSAFGAAIALTLFTERVALPAAVMSVFNVLHFLWLSLESRGTSMKS